MTEKEPYIPAAGRFAFTRIYDPAMALTMREGTWRLALRQRVSADLPEAGVAVEVGSGTGTFPIQLAGRRRDVSVIAVDGDPESIDLAKRKTDSDRVRWVEGLATELPLEDKSADVVSMSLLLHHLGAYGKRGALLEARRVLRPGGRLHVADWGRPDAITFVGFQLLRLLDGFSNTRDHAHGLVPSLIDATGFGEVTAWRRVRTFWGSIELVSAVAP
jgi:ubiquinone/menaquinone biosynthesis C-methylase UbiE